MTVAAASGLFVQPPGKATSSVRARARDLATNAGWLADPLLKPGSWDSPLVPAACVRRDGAQVKGYAWLGGSPAARPRDAPAQ